MIRVYRNGLHAHTRSHADSGDVSRSRRDDERSANFASDRVLIAEVAEQMTDQNIRRVVVVDAQQRVLGVVSQRDVLRHYLASEQGETPAAEPLNAEIQTLISRDKPVTVLPDLPLNKAAAVLAANKIGCLPVVGLKRELVGILTTTDLLRRITGRGESLKALVSLYAGEHPGKVKFPPTFASSLATW